MTIKQLASWDPDQLETLKNLGLNDEEAQRILFWIVDLSSGYYEGDRGKPYLKAFQALAKAIPARLRDNPGRTVYRALSIHMKYTEQIRAGTPFKLDRSTIESWTGDLAVATRYAKDYLSNPARIGVVIRSPVVRKPIIYLSDKVLDFMGLDRRTPRQDEVIFQGSLIRVIDNLSLERLYDGES